MLPPHHAHLQCPLAPMASPPSACVQLPSLRAQQSSARGRWGCLGWQIRSGGIAPFPSLLVAACGSKLQGGDSLLCAMLPGLVSVQAIHGFGCVGSSVTTALALGIHGEQVWHHLVWAAVPERQDHRHLHFRPFRWYGGISNPLWCRLPPPPP